MSARERIHNVWRVAFCLVWLILPAIPSIAGEKDFQRVGSQTDTISDYQARLMLADLLLRSKDPDRLSRADAVIKDLAANRPDNDKVKILRMRLEIMRKNRSKAIDLADDFLASAEFDPEIFLKLADLYVSVGQYSRTRDIYLDVMEKMHGDEKEQVMMDFADLAVLWGDFYTAEHIIRQQLAKESVNENLKLKLAKNLNAQQRYDEARKYLMRITTEKKNNEQSAHYEAWAERVSAALKEGDYAKAASVADAFIDKYGYKNIILIPGARGYQRVNRLDDAAMLYQKAVEANRQKVAALTGLGEISSNLGEHEDAQHYWEQALAIDPDASRAKILLLRATGEPVADYVEGILQSQPGPDRLSNLGGVLAMQGYRELAVSCYEAAFENDPDHFLSAIGLAETYAARGLHDKSLAVLDKVIAEYPKSYKVELTRARVLSWSARYQDAVDAYESLYQKNPDNTVVLKEAARAAYWGKMADTGQDYYQRIYTPSVDEMLLKHMRSEIAPADNTLLGSAYEKLNQEIRKGTIYKGYEAFFAWYERDGSRLQHQHQQLIENAEAELNFLYQIQKKAFLEHHSKNLAYNRRFAPAERYLQELVLLDPGNQEALFELAQMYCNLGLCDQEKGLYENLLIIDPLHGQASTALERQKIRAYPNIFGAYNLWREKGRGDLAQMVRHRADLGINFPLNCRHKLQLAAHRYVESPLKFGENVKASGFSLEGELVTGPFLSFSGGITRKFYEEDLRITDFSELAGDDTVQDSFRVGLADITLGFFNITANLDNYAHLAFGYEKKEELPNPMALAQGIYSETLKAELDIYPVRRFELGAGGAYKRYSDGNHGYIYDVAAGFSFTHHPREIKGLLSTEYRDTADTYQDCSSPGTRCSLIDDIRHPYWTPEEYWKTAVTLVFRHDLAEDFFCGARAHFYDLRMSLATESDQNHSVEIEALWQKEISDSIGMNASAMWHNSRQWDAAAMSLGMFIRF